MLGSNKEMNQVPSYLHIVILLHCWIPFHQLGYIHCRWYIWLKSRCCSRPGPKPPDAYHLDSFQPQIGLRVFEEIVREIDSVSHIGITYDKWHNFLHSSQKTSCESQDCSVKLDEYLLPCGRCLKTHLHPDWGQLNKSEHLSFTDSLLGYGNQLTEYNPRFANLKDICGKNSFCDLIWQLLSLSCSSVSGFIS